MLVLVLLISGCTRQAGKLLTKPAQVSVTTSAPADTTTAAAAGEKTTVTFTEADNGTTTNITQSTRFAVELAENPTAGLTWNATLSPGLELQSWEYRHTAAAKGMVGRRDLDLGYTRKKISGSIFSSEIQFFPRSKTVNSG
jgi:hypothetical protein